MQREERYAEGDDWRELLDDGLAAVGDSCRQVLLLRYLEEMSLEETAGRLGISVPAVAKRAERGLEKLRKAMETSGHGMSVVAVTAAMGQETSQGLPEGLAQKMAGVTTGSAGSTITAIAAGASRGLMVAKIIAIAKVAAVVAVLAGGVGLPAASFMRQSATGPIVNEADPGAPGQVRLVRTKLWVDDKVAAALKAAGKPVDTKSQWFGAMLVPTDALHRALANVRPMGGGPDMNTLYSPDRPIVWPGYGPPPPGVGIGKNRSSVVRIEPSFDGKREYGRRAGGLELHLALGGLKAIYVAGESGVNIPASIAFDGEVTGGTALVFLGAFDDAGAYCLDIWEAVRMTDAQARAVRGIEERWFTRTPAEWRDFADRTTVWQSKGKSVEQSDRMTQHAEGTMEVQLLGISNPAKWPGFWWSPAGEPIRGVTGWPDTARPVAVVRVLNGPEVKDSRMQYVNSWSSTGGTTALPNGEEKLVELPDDSGRLTMEVAGAQWRRLGVADQQNPLVAGQTEVKIARADVAGSMCTVELSCLHLPDEAVRLAALDAGGREMGSAIYLFQGLSRVAGTRGIQDSDRLAMTIFNLKGTPAKFAVELSAFQQVRFAGFALKPVVDPPPAVAAQQVKDAENREVDRHIAEVRERWAAAKQRYEAVAADDATPQGLFKRMLEAASAGRTDDVNSCITPSTDDVQRQRARVFVLVLSATVRCNDAVIAKFGLDQLVRDQVRLDVSGRYEQMIHEWQVNGDQATTAGLTMRRIDGRWRLDAASVAQNQKMATHVERRAEALETIRAAVVDGQISTTRQLGDAIKQLPDP